MIKHLVELLLKPYVGRLVTIVVTVGDETLKLLFDTGGNKTFIEQSVSFRMNSKNESRSTQIARGIMSIWKVNVDHLDKLFVVWAFLFQIVLIAHFAARKPFFESYTIKYGWIVYALCIPALIISLLLLRGGKSWSFWLGGFLFVAFAAFGYWVDYVAQIQFRNPLQLSILLPYALLYLATVMFYWWPIGLLSRPLWFVYAILFVIATYLNITSH